MAIGRGQLERPLATTDGLLIGPPLIKMDCQKEGDLPQTTLIAEGGSEGLRLAQHRQDPL
jgi:hypothetical protein